MNHSDNEIESDMEVSDYDEVEEEEEDIISDIDDKEEEDIESEIIAYNNAKKTSLKRKIIDKNNYSNSRVIKILSGEFTCFICLVKIKTVEDYYYHKEQYKSYCKSCNEKLLKKEFNCYHCGEIIDIIDNLFLIASKIQCKKCIEKE
jgi:hypothetical protein